MRTSYGNVTIADGYAARDRLIAKARRRFVMPAADLPDDLPRVAAPVFWWQDRQPIDLGDGWVGYANGAAYNPAADVSAQDWWTSEPDRDARRAAYAARVGPPRRRRRG